MKNRARRRRMSAVYFLCIFGGLLIFSSKLVNFVFG